MALKATSILYSMAMTYQVLARKWRPKTFDEMVGQNHVLQALINSLNKQRLHHAYLFTGTRGVGKTTIARLLAKALNCEQGISATPCLQCDICVAINQNSFIDLIEIDGASRTKVEDTREILDNVQYSPTQGRFKIYLIDEVHMLSNHSFNALLKTLEEPPSHVKFLLATTDPQKLPVTVLSRCLQFSLKCMTCEQISHHLAHVLEQETIEFEQDALNLLAKSADGSMRDGLSLLDQAIAYGNDNISTTTVRQMLGFTQKDFTIELLQALMNQDTQTLMSINQQLLNEGADFHLVLDELLTYLHQLSVLQWTLESQQTSMSNTEDSSNQQQLIEIAKQLLAEDIQLFYQIAIKGKETLLLAPTPALGFEMTLLRMIAFRPANQAVTKEPLPTPATESITAPAKTEVKIETRPIPTPQQPAQESNNIKDESSWGAIIEQMRLSPMTKNVAQHASLVKKENNMVELGIESGHQSMFTPTVVERLQSALNNFYQTKINLTITVQKKVIETPAKQQQAQAEQQLASAQQSIEQDPVANEIIDAFNGQLIEESVTAINSETDKH